MLYERKFAGRILKVETDSLASQASGSVLVTFGKTMILGTATMGMKDTEMDFFPLTVAYEERFSAAGKIIGSRYMRREGRPSEAAILVSRMVDRAIRPHFPKDLKREIQVILTVLAFDEENDPDFSALFAASMAISMSDIPWDGPVVGVRVGSHENEKKEDMINPTYCQRSDNELDLFISGTRESDSENEVLINMLDGSAKEISENKILSAIDSSKKDIEELLLFQDKIIKKEGKKKLILEKQNEDINSLLNGKEDEIKRILCRDKEDFSIPKGFGGDGDEKDRSDASKKYKKTCLSKKEAIVVREKLIEEMEIDYSLFEKMEEKVLHNMVLKEGKRPDGRKIDEVRKIGCSSSVLPRAHGSGLFCRGLTHVVSTLTLGAPGDELLLEGMEIAGKKRFLHHYNFPPFSVGEVKRLGSPGRREIGHGALAEKAIEALIPKKEEFPYTIRIVSEILSSNGSTSMASACAASLALFDAGVPIKRAVAGISCGLIMEEDTSKPVSKRNYKILTDIQGPEDSLGDMDLKVAGTRKGITAIQLDIKLDGLTSKILKEGLEKAKEAREKILDEMEKTLPEHRKDLSPWAPRIITIKISPDKIRDVIGPGGKMINEIIEKTETSIDIEDDGSVFVTAKDSKGAEKAIDWIKEITREAKEGEEFEGKIKTITDFGLFIEILPGQDGLLHISEIFPNRNSKNNLNSKFELGQILKVKIKKVDPSGKISLILLKDVFEKK